MLFFCPLGFTKVWNQKIQSIFNYTKSQDFVDIAKTSYDVYNEEIKTALSKNMLKVIMKSCVAFSAQYFNQEIMCGEPEMQEVSLQIK